MHRLTRDPYLTTDSSGETVRSLEVAADFLEAAVEDPEASWAWAIIALHSAVQGFMVLALTGTWNVTALHRDQRAAKIKAQRVFYDAVAAGDDSAAAESQLTLLGGDEELAAFVRLFERICSPSHGMMQYTDSKAYEPAPSDEQCMKCLNGIRNEFVHFVPLLTRKYLLTRLVAVAEVGVRVIDFLLHESGNVRWRLRGDPRGLQARSDAALDRASAAVARLLAEYDGLERPEPPLCGSESTNRL